MKTIITSESVNIGHPDKTCDTIADAILDEALKQDSNAKMAVECAIKDDLLMIYGEATTTAKIDYEEVARKILREIGYKCEFKIIKKISEQSPEINSAVERPELTAGDQGIVYGYATNETPELMPLPIMLSHRLMTNYSQLLKKDARFHSDAKCQVSIEYTKGKPRRIHTILISVSHDETISHPEIEQVIRKEVIRDIGMHDSPEIIINPSGKFTIWGSFSDSGCVGRKIVVDTYGGVGRVGGGAFSSKDPSKIDRSAAYYCRYVAKNIVSHRLAEKCEVSASYAIGLSEPLKINIETFGTEKIPLKKIYKIVQDNFDFRPASIIRELDLLAPIYKTTACYGHFGREDFSWEKQKTLVF